MKKVITYAITLLVVTLLTVSGTYAYFSATVGKNQTLGETARLEAIFTGDAALNKELILGKSKEQGYSRTISIGLAEDSLEAAANLYIYVEQISTTLATDALNWELYRIENGTEKHVKSGTFAKCGNIGEAQTTCRANKKAYMLTDYQLSTTPTEFVIYLWLNGALVDNSVLGATFKGYIGAETENITGILE